MDNEAKLSIEELPSNKILKLPIMIGVPWVWKWTINSRPFEANSAPEVTDMNLKTIEKLQIIRSDVCSIRAVKFSPSHAARPAIF